MINLFKGQEPFNKIDEISMHHDICYRDNPQNKKIVIKLCLWIKLKYNPINKCETFDKKLVKSLIETKYKLGLGLDIKNDMKELAEELHKAV